MSQSVPTELGAALSELAGLLLSTNSFEQLLQGVAELSVRVIEPVATCGITLAQDDRVITAASADALARQLDEQQYEHKAGPCLQSLSSGEVVEAADLATTLSDHLRIALSSRSVIDQAIGIVMVQRHCDPDTAFATLRTISQRRNIKLRTVAAELVTAIQSPSPDNPPQP